mgnify:CR=1 FL=1
MYIHICICIGIRMYGMSIWYKYMNALVDTIALTKDSKLKNFPLTLG